MNWEPNIKWYVGLVVSDHWHFLHMANSVLTLVCFLLLLQGASPRGFPSYDAVGLAKSSIQQRINQVTRELHALEEQKDLQSLRLDRMEKFAQSVLSAEPQEDGRGDRHFRSPSSPKKRKGSRSNSPVDPSGASTKKHKVTKQ